MATSDETNGVIIEPITRADVRNATIRAVHAARQSPYRIRLTHSQGNRIKKGLRKKS